MCYNGCQRIIRKCALLTFHYTLRKKGRKVVTGAVPFQKVHFCTQRMHIGTLVVHLAPKMYILVPKMYILAPEMYILTLTM